MKENKTIEKELLFKNKIKEITSISLDSDYKVENKEIVGNFLINGEYKIHEISINKEKFNFKIPFKHDVYNDIDEKTVKLEINNFVYDYKHDELIVNIDYEIIGDRKDVLQFDDEKSLDEFLNSKELEVIDTRIDEIKSDIDKSEEEENTELVVNDDEDTRADEIEEVLSINEDKNQEKEETTELTVEEKEEVKSVQEENDEERNEINTDNIIDNINNINDNYVTYKVYKITESDTLESIVMRHRTTLDELKEYNDLTNIKVNDKIIIPDYE